MEKLLGVFDFDFTVIAENSDIIARDLLPPEVLKARLKDKDSRGWTAYMNKVFELLFEEGVTIEKLKESIVGIPAVPNFVKFFNDLKTINCDVIIISDANEFFIDLWLKDKRIRDIVHTVYSNPTHIHEGRLHIQQYHEQDWCQRSTRNLCKGHILQTHIASVEAKEGIKYAKTFYVGDGHNDLCPSLKLKEQDFVFPRKNFPLERELISSKEDIKAKVIPWSNTDEIWSVVKHF